MVFTVAGGLGLFLYGMQLMGDGLQKAAGDRLRRLLEVLTGVPIVGVFVGALVTMIIQSSSATTVMVVGFVNAGLMNLTQSISVILGAKIGTTITAQMVSLKLTDLALPAIAVGFLLSLIGRTRMQKQVGQVIIGFGVLFLGMKIMSDGLVPLRSNPLFMHYMVQFGAKPLLGLLTGTVITAIIQSSSAFTGIVISLALQDLIGLDAAVPLVLGSNIGTCATALLASIGTSLSARRAALSHVLIAFLGVIVFFPFLGAFTAFVGTTADTVAHQAANAHTLFNVINVIWFLPFIKPFSRLVTRLLPGEEIVVEYGPKYLDVHLLTAPSVALGQVTKELIRMGETSIAMLDDVYIGFKTASKEHLKASVQKETVLNSLEHDIVMYLVKLSQRSLSDEQSRRLNALLNISNDLERVGDHSENIQELADYRWEHKLPFSAEAISELDDMHTRVRGLVQAAIQALGEDDIELAKDIMRREDEIDMLEKELRRSHISRLGDNVCHPASGIVFLDIISNLERIADHANNIAETVIKQ